MADEEAPEYDVDSFMAITEAPADTAQFFMEAASGNLQQAINMFAGALPLLLRGHIYTVGSK